MTMSNSEFNIEIRKEQKSIVLTFDNEYTITGSWGLGMKCSYEASEDYFDDEFSLFSVPDLQVTVNDPLGEIVPFTKGIDYKENVTPEQFVSIAYHVSNKGKEIIDE
jgi:hypothetical protein